MAWVSTWIFASAKSTSRPFIQIFLTSSNGIGGPPGSVDCCSGRAPSSRSRGWPEYRGPLKGGQCDFAAILRVIPSREDGEGSRAELREAGSVATGSLAVAACPERSRRAARDDTRSVILLASACLPCAAKPSSSPAPPPEPGAL